MSYTDFKEVINVDPGDSTHYGSDQLKEIVQIFNNKIVASRRPNIKNPWRFSDRIEIMAAPSIPTAPTATNFINLFLDPNDFHLKSQDSTGTLNDLQAFSLDTNILAYNAVGSNVAGDILKNNATKYVRFPRGAQDTVLTASSTDLVYQKIVDANVAVGAAIGWSKVSKTGSVLHDIANASTLSTAINGQVPTWNSGASRWDPATPPGSGTGEANTASNVGTAGIGVWKQKTAVNLEFKKINPASSKISVVDNTGASQVDLDVVEANVTISNLAGTLSNAQTPTTPTGKTYGIDTNTIKHSTTNAQGDIMAYDATSTKYIRIPRGTNNQLLQSSASDISWVTRTIPTAFGGVAVFSGDGTTKVFNIAHGAGTTPTKYSVTFASTNAGQGQTVPTDHQGPQFWVTADATNLVLNYTGTAPTTGTNNLSFAWMVFT